MHKNVTVLKGHFVWGQRGFHLETKVIPETHGKHFAAVAIVGKRNTAPTIANQAFLYELKN